MTPLDGLIDSADLKCTACGASRGRCDCWEQCSCGWYARKGEPCNNPKAGRCSTKVKHGVYNRKTKRWERKK